MKVAFIVFAKAPIKNFVKTRLAEHTNHTFAFQSYKMMLRWQWNNLQDIINQNYFSTQSKIFIYTAKPMLLSFKEAKQSFSFLPSIKQLQIVEQSNGNLGTRLNKALQNTQKKFDYVIIWGTDVPLLTIHDFKEVLHNFPRASVIKSMDGGYNLIALNTQDYSPNLFSNIRWSTNQTWFDQKNRLQEHRIPFDIVATKPDLDTTKDIVKNILHAHKERDAHIKKIYIERLYALETLLKE